MPFSASAAGPYIGGELWQRGLLQSGQNISEGIQKAISESRKMEEEQAADQVILNYGKQIGLVTPEIEAQYIKGGHSQKTGIVGGLIRQFAMQQQKAQEDRLAEQDKRVPFTINGQTFSVHPETAATLAERQMAAQKERELTPNAQATANRQQAREIKSDIEDATGMPIHAFDNVEHGDFDPQTGEWKPNPQGQFSVVGGKKQFTVPGEEVGWLSKKMGYKDKPAQTIQYVEPSQVLKREDAEELQAQAEQRKALIEDRATAKKAAAQPSGPPAGTRGTIQGKPVVWDGKGWVAR